MADAAPKTQTKTPSNQSDHEKQSKFFLYKAALVTLLLVLVPLFPSLAPDFFNQTFHSTSWELLQLIFVGIAVSYGLFSKKNDVEPHKDNHKIDNAQLYLSKLLQVSSVFDDESESESEPQAVIEENKFQALNSQYQRGEPVVVVEEQNDAVSQISQKPLLLPVRSLNHPLPNPNSRAGEAEEEEEEEKVVLRSPIPWQSRSGRMKMKESGDEEITSPSLNLKRSDQSRSFRGNPNSSSSSSSSSSPLLHESESKRGEDAAVRKKSFVPPPPAPPPPPSPAFLRKSVLMKSNSSIGNAKTGLGSGEKVLERSARSVPSEELSEAEMMRSDEGISTSNGEEESGPDVDKKADEFIAKFREQIRRQRIETIRRSAAQRAGKNTTTAM
ncbi:serine/threonine-protein kinase CST20 [Salvia hispanica]|uniref:serine/threonine-protein kinase CST20 n=1 Tax=Salvia hispanica TaxID=49212 RepID=UPI0020099E5E|nr:serine/threonine-protein kinase CST20 [Salvia hispanica]